MKAYAVIAMPTKRDPKQLCYRMAVLSPSKLHIYAHEYATARAAAKRTHTIAVKAAGKRKSITFLPWPALPAEIRHNNYAAYFYIADAWLII